MDEKFELLKHAVSCYKVNAANRYINKKELLEFIDEIELLMLGGVSNRRELLIAFAKFCRSELPLSLFDSVEQNVDRFDGNL